ncbi:MAG: hypothetical protein ACLQVD_05585 [Capsulimonadaceae bacterium]
MLTFIAHNHWFFGLCWLLGLAITFSAWRWTSRAILQRTLRNRFYALRDRCVQLVAEGVVEENDRLFQRLYDGTNRLAADAVDFDFAGLVIHATEAVKSTHPEELARFRQDIESRPAAFQSLVTDFYKAIWMSMIDSSTILQFIVVMTVLKITSSNARRLVAAAINKTPAIDPVHRRLKTWTDMWNVSKSARLFAEGNRPHATTV